MRTNFRGILEGTRRQAAESAWHRAKNASRLRHAVSARGDTRTANYLGRLKERALQLAANVLPEAVHVTIDDGRYLGLVQVRFDGHGQMHLPAASQIG